MSYPIVKSSTAFAMFMALLFVSSLSLAQKTLTIASPLGEKEITLSGDPAVTVSYTPSGMRIEFTNIAMSVICIEDPSASGKCRLQAYDGGIPTSGPSMPGTPGRPSASPGDGSVTLTWTAPTSDGGAAITGYRIQVAAAGSLSFSDIVSNTASDRTTYTVNGLTNGSSYQFRIAAINSTGAGSNSAASEVVTPEAGGPPPPSTGIASACNDAPGDVLCEIIFDGRLDDGANLTIKNVPSGKIYSTPFLVPSDDRFGAITVTSFTDQPGYFFKIWFSSSAGGPVLDPTAPEDSCEHSAPYAEFALRYMTGSGAGFPCKIGDLDIVYVNYAFVRDSDGAYGSYPSLKIEI